jgi:cell wall-associated NlpC family hydrolase
MLKRLLVLTLFFLTALSIRAQKTEPFSSTETPGNKTPGVNRTDLIAFAKNYLGTPYLRAGTDPKKGFDCSGFVSFVYKHFNLVLPRSSRDYKALGKALNPKDFKVGDVLVFYGFRDKGHIGHVGIVCEADGMKTRFIHASSGRAHCVTISNLDSEGYRRRFYKCVDVIR